jgi:hypothetical protein
MLASSCQGLLVRLCGQTYQHIYTGRLHTDIGCGQPSNILISTQATYGTYYTGINLRSSLSLNHPQPRHDETTFSLVIDESKLMLRWLAEYAVPRTHPAVSRNNEGNY